MQNYLIKTVYLIGFFKSFKLTGKLKSFFKQIKNFISKLNSKRYGCFEF